jgi:hypothetical protein
MPNEKKNATLGMSYGTASNRLRKMIMFDFAKKLKKDVCFRCNKQILKIEELSIEHIKPWEGISAELFWDLENIAFSHLHCNCQHIRRDLPLLHERNREYWKSEGSRNAQAPEGTSWCFGHKQFLPVDNFGIKVGRICGLQSYCKECRTSPSRTGFK